MWFKAFARIQQANITEDSTLPLSVDLQGRIQFQIHRVDAGDAASVEIAALVERSLPPRVSAILEALLRDPDQFLPTNPDGLVMIDGRLQPMIPGLELRHMPPEYADFQRDVFKTLSTAARACWGLLHWRKNAVAVHGSLGSPRLSCAQDGQVWTLLPPDYEISVFNFKALHIEPSDAEDLAALVREHREEPLAFEMLREASSFGRSSRAGLLACCSALEAGVKQHITHLVPQTKWLLEKMQAPSLQTLLCDVIPNLHRGLRTPCAPFFPLNKDNTDFLKKLVTRRNDVAHGKKHSVEVPYVHDAISFVHDVLFALEWCKGHEWARAHVQGTVFNIAGAGEFGEDRLWGPRRRGPA
jgi:hypothetical protein